MIIASGNVDLWYSECLSNQGSSCDPECSCVCGNDGDDSGSCSGSVTH